ncbi:unnamed protein product [Adineta ricciae]|uniref:Uncharacterized protein n=1 Tax=Adineta ricciae TaxID=249248 RepID=A0A815M1L1_ADIRI|nr:unnamed protein product [Adineta ricciae]CAF1548407.1 unnamed protein product [Adineta ricciae]
MLLLNATDHQLFQNFFDIEPNKEYIALLQHSLLLTTLKATSSLLHKIINNIDTNIQKLNDPSTQYTTTYTSSNTIETLLTLEKHVIQEAIFIHPKELEQIQTTIQKEQKKFFVQNKYMQTTPQY